MATPTDADRPQQVSAEDSREIAYLRRVVKDRNGKLDVLNAEFSRYKDAQSVILNDRHFMAELLRGLKPLIDQHVFQAGHVQSSYMEKMWSYVKVLLEKEM